MNVSSLPFLFAAFLPMARAFPPAPYYTLYGTVHDQVGQTLTAEGAVLILLKDSEEISRAPISREVLNGQTYELNVRIDLNRLGTTAYTDKAIAAGGVFSVAVEMNGARYYPIEASNTLTAGTGGERVRLDLNLGEDADKDGLPDIWEQWQLYQAGLLPDANGAWPINLITRNGDYDKDGLSNWQEYVAGTFAGDATEKLELRIKEKQASNVRCEFYGITGKTYTVETSSDGLTWAAVNFSVGSPGVGSPSHRAASVGIVSVYAATTAATSKQFYRLTVR